MACLGCSTSTVPTSAKNPNTAAIAQTHGWACTKNSDARNAATDPAYGMKRDGSIVKAPVGPGASLPTPRRSQVEGDGADPRHQRRERVAGEVHQQPAIGDQRQPEQRADAQGSPACDSPARPRQDQASRDQEDQAIRP